MPREPPARFNEVLRQGLMAGKPYPVIHSIFETSSDEDDSDD